MRKRIGDKPLTNAEKQRRYREKRKAQGLKRAEAWQDTTGKVIPKKGKAQVVDNKAAERRAAWEAELKQEKLKAAKAEGRRLAREADNSRENGRIEGILAAANFLGRSNPAIAQFLTKYFMIDRERAEAVLQEDKRTKSMTLASLDKIKAFDPPPPMVKE
jgi:hypothetical protein